MRAAAAVSSRTLGPWHGCRLRGGGRISHDARSGRISQDAFFLICGVGSCLHQAAAAAASIRLVPWGVGTGMRAGMTRLACSRMQREIETCTIVSGEIRVVVFALPFFFEVVSDEMLGGRLP